MGRKREKKARPGKRAQRRCHADIGRQHQDQQRYLIRGMEHKMGKGRVAKENKRVESTVRLYHRKYKKVHGLHYWAGNWQREELKSDE